MRYRLCTLDFGRYTACQIAGVLPRSQLMSSSQDISAHAAPVRISGRSVTLAHLMLWMFATCLVLAQNRWYLAAGENLDARDYWYHNLHALLYSPLQGAGLAAFLLCLCRRFGGGPAFPAEPGHWLLVISGANQAFAAGLEYMEVWVGPQEVFEQMPAWFHHSRHLASVGLQVGLAIAAAACFRRSRMWRTAFLVMILNPLAGLLHSSLFIAFNSGQWILNELAWSIGFRVLYSLPAAFALAAAIGDWRHSRQRDFLHWAGIGVLIVLALIEWPVFVLWRYMFR